MPINDNGHARIAYAADFESTTVTLTPEEWQELCALLEYRKQTKPCAFCKLSKPIYEKLKANPPKLKNQYKVIKE